MLDKIDWALLRLATSLSHWADYRWHINNYRIAKWLTQLAAVCVVAVAVMGFLPLTKASVLDVWNISIACLNVLIAYSYSVRAGKLQAASDRYERGDQRHIPSFVAMHYMVGPGMRLFSGTLCIALSGSCVAADIALHHSWLYTSTTNIGRLWLFFGDCAAIYFAMVLPSGRKRKEKKAHDWSFGLTPQPVGGRT